MFTEAHSLAVSILVDYLQISVQMILNLGPGRESSVRLMSLSMLQIVGTNHRFFILPALWPCQVTGLVVDQVLEVGVAIIS